MTDDSILKNFVKPLIYETSKLVGGVKKIMALPCSSPVEVYVETLVPAVLGAWYSIIEPDAKEVYHKVTGKSFVCDFGSTAEKAFKMAGGPENGVTRFIFKSLPAYDLATWYFFLADIAAEGLVNWTSMIYAQRECADKANPWYGSGPGFAGAARGGIPAGGLDFSFPMGSAFYPVNPADITIGLGRTGGIACSIQMTLDQIPVAISSWIQIGDFGPGRLDQYSNDKGDGTPRGNAITFGKMKNTTGEILNLYQFILWNGPETVQVFMNNDVSHCTKFGQP